METRANHPDPFGLDRQFRSLKTNQQDRAGGADEE
jgi:hypothetical protein